MRTFLKWLLRGILLSAVLIAIIAASQREKLGRLMAVNSLFSEDRIVENFTQMDTMFETVAVPAEGTTSNELAPGATMEMPAGYTTWADDRAVTGIVVLQNGVIRYEDYPLTAVGEDDPASSRRISWSVAKSFLSVLMGILHEDGTIPDLDAPVTQYAPTLAGTAYDGATIRNVLQMSSGVEFDEDYLDFWSDINKMGRVLALGQSMDGFAEGLDATFAPAGETWQYVSIDTHIIGMVIRGATGRSIPDLLSEKVITPLRPTATPYYLTDGYGIAFVLGGLNLTTHDYALFGHMIANGGISFGTRIVSEDWIIESTAPSANTTPDQYGYGYQWWVPIGATEGQFMARGIYGQYIYIDRPRGVVIAVNSADRGFRNEGVDDSNVDMFRLIAGSLD
ncbi:serine hydrolase domain-containing protein [Octadecabacter ascidiaceicola]|uniref:6-aminohexanoate-dimer hydrolase n=1 Tax=Octadecabacter ascidiaceicola TaxID=1655543 RepID=A0A238KNR1_9RHOB|nr:serine hydrolase [Octadecabacter ascidiaceicola]SMX44435.1 6-aminohexanoate-dimer hydrolase [Octadecabacter ascidiaceicola]